MTNWKRYAPGLYVDDTQTLVITSEADTTQMWSIRRLIEMATLEDGRVFPDYGSVWHGDAITYREAKVEAERMIADMISKGEPMGPLGERPWAE